MIGAIAPVAFASGGGSVTASTLTQQKLDGTVQAKGNGVKVQTKVPTEIVMQRVTFLAGGFTGWHHHPGVVMVSVQSGAVTVWDSDCDSTTYGPGLPAGTVFTESGDDALEVTSAMGGTVLATFIVPQVAGGKPLLRLEDDKVSCVGTEQSDDDRHEMSNADHH